MASYSAAVWRVAVAMQGTPSLLNSFLHSYGAFPFLRRPVSSSYRDGVFSLAPLQNLWETCTCSEHMW